MVLHTSSYRPVSLPWEEEKAQKFWGVFSVQLFQHQSDPTCQMRTEKQRGDKEGKVFLKATAEELPGTSHTAGRSEVERRAVKYTGEGDYSSIQSMTA